MVRRKSETIGRRLELWEILLEPLTDESVPPDVVGVFERIQALPFTVDAPEAPEPDGIRELKVDNDILVVDCSDIAVNHIVGVFGKGKTVDVPTVRSGRQERDIVLKEGEWIEFPSHFVLFEKGLAVFERNPHGPSPSSLGLVL